MNETRTGWFWVALAGAVLLALLIGQWLAATALRREVAVVRLMADERRQLEHENARLRPVNRATAEIDALRSDRAALARLRHELDAIGAKLKQRKRTPRPGGPAPRTEALAVPADEWRNAGRATPRNAFETFLWAAAGGDVELMAKTLVLDAAADRPARELFARLPASMQARYGSPLGLIASLSAAEVTFGSMWVRQENQAADSATLRVLLQWRDSSRMPVFTLRRGADGWQLVVPPGAVAKYAAMLRLPESRSG